MSTTDPLLLDPAVANKKRKVRGSWISFGGRIVAQVIGAVASIMLALTFIQPGPTSSAAAAAVVAEPPKAVRPAPPRDPRQLTIAVLPLANHSGDVAQDFLASSMTEALIANLAQVKPFHVISRTSAIAFARSNKALPQVADELGADVVIEGAVLRVGSQLRVSVQLIDGIRDRYVWAGTYDRALTDILRVERELSAEIVNRVREELLPFERAKAREAEGTASRSGN
jgi:TolB-like protein